MEQKPSMDPKTLIAIILCMAIWFGWQKHLEKKYPALTTPQEEIKATDAAKEGASTKPTKGGATYSSAELEKAANLPEKTWVYENESWKVVVSSVGGRISEAQLKKYASDHKAKVVELVTPEEKGFLNVAVERGSSAIDFSHTGFSLKQLSKEKIELVGARDGIIVKKTLTFNPDKFMINSRFEVSGNTKGIKFFDVSNGMAAPIKQSGGFTFFGLAPPAEGYQEFFVLYKNKNDRVMIHPSEDVQKSFEQSSLGALGSRYFTTILMNKGNVLAQTDVQKKENMSELKMRMPVLDNSPSTSYDFDFFAGPKSIPILKSIGEAAAKVVDYGMFSSIAHPLLSLMEWFYSIVHNWGLAIILLTILVRTLTFPFTYMSYKSMKGIQKIQPEIARLKEKYKGDTQTFNVEMMKLYRENKVNPMGGCLPTLLQLPVFWALYQVLQNSIELYKAPFIFWINDLSQKDPYYVLPILMGVSMMLQQKLTPSTMDPAQAKMMMIMPIFFSFLMIGLPSGLTLYIFVSTLFGIIQQLLIMRDRSSVTPPRGALVTK